jgi:hypothetical protein
MKHILAVVLLACALTLTVRADDEITNGDGSPYHAYDFPIVELGELGLPVPSTQVVGGLSVPFTGLNLGSGDWLDLAGWAPTNTYSDGTYSASLDDATFTSAGQLRGAYSEESMFGLKAGEIDITFSLGSGANAIEFNDIASGGGDINVFYQTGKGPVREVMIERDISTYGRTEVLFPKAVTNIFVSAFNTSIEGLNIVPVHEHHDGNVPMVPEANPAPMIGALLFLGAVVYHLRRNQIPYPRVAQRARA